MQEKKKKKGKEKKISFPLQKHTKIQLFSTEEVVTAMGARSAPSQGWKKRASLVVMLLLLGGHMSRDAGFQLCPWWGGQRGYSGFSVGILCKVRICRSTQQDDVSHLPHLLLQHQ